ncbi:MAG TPA: SRPBCC domain-containing protein [Thermoanaerobaculia bacterium]
MRDHPNANEPAADRELIVTRVFDAPARILFEAYSKCEHIRRWFGPRGYPVTMCEIDFRVGGRYRFAMTGPEGLQDPFGGEYLEIVPNQKIVFTNGFELPDAGRMIMTVTFEEDGERTTLTMHTLFDSIAMKESYVGMGMKEGIDSGFDQLAELAAEMRSR